MTEVLATVVTTMDSSISHVVAEGAALDGMEEELQTVDMARAPEALLLFLGIHIAMGTIMLQMLIRGHQDLLSLMVQLILLT